jgi:hypothetical protein
MPTDILALSWKVQVALASGYAAYIISYRGIRAHHSAQDTVFLALVFSLIASAELWLARSLSPLVAGACAFLLSVAVGVLWRRRGRQMLTSMLRGPNTTWSDDTPSAWARLQENRENPVSQLSVLLKDGTWLNCDETARFNAAPYAPCVLGTNGDVLMYLTSTTAKGTTEDKEQSTVLHERFGARLTYVPSSEIARVNIRLMPSINRPARAGASPPTSSGAATSAGYWRQLRSGLALALRKAAAAISPK